MSPARRRRLDEALARTDDPARARADLLVLLVEGQQRPVAKAAKTLGLAPEQAQAVLDADHVPHRECRGWGLASRRTGLTDAERQAGQEHLALCRHCRDRKAAQDRARTAAQTRAAGLTAAGQLGTLLSPTTTIATTLAGKAAAIAVAAAGTAVLATGTTVAVLGQPVQAPTHVVTPTTAPSLAPSGPAVAATVAPVPTTAPSPSTGPALPGVPVPQVSLPPTLLPTSLPTLPVLPLPTLPALPLPLPTLPPLLPLP